MTLVHLTTSSFFGGPERQMLGLGRQLPGRSHHLLFPDQGWPVFARRLEQAGLPCLTLAQTTPHLWAAACEVAAHLRLLETPVLFCHGYKADLVGWVGARLSGVPVVAVSRGWTAATARVRAYETLDRRVLRLMDAVVCVSEAQAQKVRRAGVPARRVSVIRNAIDAAAIPAPTLESRQRLLDLFPAGCRRVVISCGRLSPEKGFGVLVEAAALVRQANPSIGFVHLGDGPLRASLAGRIAELGLGAHFQLLGFRERAEEWIAAADLMALPSFTEGLPNVALEAAAAGVPIVATAVGGTPEVVEDGVTGYLVRAGSPEALARQLLSLAADETARLRMARAGRRKVEAGFTFPAQARSYLRLFDELRGTESADSASAPNQSPHPGRHEELAHSVHRDREDLAPAG